MPRGWPKDLAWTDVVLDVENPWCGECGGRMHVRAHGHHRIFTFGGPVHLIYKLVQCVDSDCSNHHRTFSPEQVLTWTATISFSRKTRSRTICKAASVCWLHVNKTRRG